MYYTFREIHEQLKNVNIPNDPGVYRVYIPKDFEIKFERPKFKDAEDNECQTVLDKARVKYDANIGLQDDGRQLVYIGKAKNLRRRVKQYVKYGYGKCTNHKGGKYIFTIKDWYDFIIEIETLSVNEANKEADLIAEFKEKYGVLPFANLVSGHHVVSKL